MQRMNYFQCKAKGTAGYIFSKRSPVRLIRNSTENTLSHTVSTTLINTSDIALPKKLRNTPHDDECTVAEEFNENEEHIFSDLEKRESDKLPKLSITPKVKLLSERLLRCERKRSVTFTHGVFSRRKKYIATTIIKNPSLKIIKEEQKAIEDSPHLKLRNSSIDSKLGASTKKRKQKENFDISYNTSGNTKEDFDDPKHRQPFRIDGRWGRDLKDKLTALMSKGPNKFSSTTQARPKIMARKEDMLTDCAESQADNLNTIRTNRMATCPVYVIKQKQ
eukprot:TRINITY_DN3868_c0_g6_i1.p1 TRINITY_DN3868_c0_g6~~TRINITY_DN3868_c0_g6_i1.p1  ORF type:complete len:277 (-),score=85.18 TRINITY_DN3868_c0_g6_i1:141-971(-)